MLIQIIIVKINLKSLAINNHKNLIFAKIIKNFEIKSEKLYGNTFLPVLSKIK